MPEWSSSGRGRLSVLSYIFESDDTVELFPSKDALLFEPDEYLNVRMVRRHSRRA